MTSSLSYKMAGILPMPVRWDPLHSPDWNAQEYRGPVLNIIKKYGEREPRKASLVLRAIVILLLCLLRHYISMCKGVISDQCLCAV